MNHNDMEVRVERHSDAVAPGKPGTRDASLGELFKQLSGDTSELIRKEAELAKVEMREMGSALATDAAKIGAAAGLAMIGAFALTAFLILLLGNLFGGAFWLSALLVGLVALGIGAVMGRNAVNDVKERGLKPTQTLATLREDKTWASQQARELKHDLTTDPTTPSTRK